MNPDEPLTPREELELKITALLLGELDAAEADRVRQAIAKDAELTKLHDQLQQTLDLVKAASANLSAPTDSSGASEQLRLPAPKRNALLAHFKIVSPKRFEQTKRPSSSIRLLELAAILLLIAMLAAMLLPALSKSKAKSSRIMVLHNLKQVELAKQLWAEDHAISSSDEAPTKEDLEPYLRQWPNSVQGESYDPGKLSETAAALIEPQAGTKPMKGMELISLGDGRQVYRFSAPSLRNDHFGENQKVDRFQVDGPPATRSDAGASRPSGMIANLEQSVTERGVTKVNIALPSSPQRSPGYGNTEGEQTAWGMPATQTGRQANPPATGAEEFGFYGVKATDNRNADFRGGFVAADAYTDAKRVNIRSIVDESDRLEEYAPSSTVPQQWAEGVAPKGSVRRESRTIVMGDRPVAGLVFNGGIGSISHGASPADGFALEQPTQESFDFVYNSPSPMVVAGDYITERVDTEANSQFSASGRMSGGGGVGGTGAGLAGQSETLSHFSRTLEDQVPAGKPVDTLLRMQMGREAQASAPDKTTDRPAIIDLGMVTDGPSADVAPRERKQVALGTRWERERGSDSTDSIALPKGKTSEMLAFAKDPTSGGTRPKSKVKTMVLEEQPLESTGEIRDLVEANVADVAGTPAPPRTPSAPTPTPQPEVQTASNAFSTFSLNVSDVSFKLAAASLEQGQMPDVATIRSEEFLNAFNYRDPAPASGQPLAFAWERARYPFAHNRDLLRLSVQTAARGREPGRPLNLVLLLDNSGSMERADRVRIIRECLNVLASQLTPQDKVSVVTFARTARLWVDGVPGVQAAASLANVGQLTPEGGTNLEEAMNLAYATAHRHYLPDGVNRVVLLTDGAANLGNVDPESLKSNVEAQRKQGIALDCFGIGWEGYNDDVLELLSRNGDGRYGFVNTPQAAASEFAAQLAGALQVAASDVKVQVEFNLARVTAYRQIGYAKHQLTKEQFRDNTVDAAEIGAAESGNALYVFETNPQGQGPIATARARFKVPGTGEYKEYEWTVPYAGQSVPLENASPAMRVAASASAFSEWLVASPYAAEVSPDKLLNILRGAPEVFGADPRPRKLEWMIREASRIGGH